MQISQIWNIKISPTKRGRHSEIITKKNYNSWEIIK